MLGDVGNYLSVDPLPCRFISSIMRDDGRSTDRVLFGDRYVVWRGRKTVVINYLVDGTFDRSKQGTEPKNLERYLFARVHRSQMFMTESESIGMVAANCNVRESDEVWFLTGGLTPFVMRREFAKHRLLSPCYLAEHMASDQWIRRSSIGKLDQSSPWFENGNSLFRVLVMSPATIL